MESFEPLGVEFDFQCLHLSLIGKTPFAIAVLANGCLWLEQQTGIYGIRSKKVNVVRPYVRP